MKRVLGWIFNRWVLLAVLVLAVALLIWIVGPLVAIGEARPLDTARSRWITIGVLVLIVALCITWNRWRAKRGNTAVVNQLLQQPAADVPERESADMREPPPQGSRGKIGTASVAPLRRPHSDNDGIASE